MVPVRGSGAEPDDGEEVMGEEMVVAYLWWTVPGGEEGEDVPEGMDLNST